MLRPVLLGTGVIGACALLAMTLLSPDLLGRVAPATGQMRAEAPQVAVVDGDTLRLRDRVVRLLGVAAPERGQTCHPSSGPGFDCGVAAANALAQMVRETPVDCELHGADPMGRALAFCRSGGRQLNRAIVAAGWARADASVPALKTDEQSARAERLGLWATEAGRSW